jgi:hypothetical protein
MKVLFVIFALLALTAIILLVLLLLGIVRCAQAQEDCDDDLLGGAATCSGKTTPALSDAKPKQ